MSLLDAVYRVSDLLIVDEADRVQVQWDTTFAAPSQLVGGDKALLDQLHRRLGTLSVGGEGRSRAAELMFNRLTNLDDKANTIANHLFRLIAKSPKLAKWIERRQVTDADIYWRLAEYLTHLRSETTDPTRQEEFGDELNGIFKAFWRQPLRSSVNLPPAAQFLTDWINRLIAAD